MGVRDQNVDSRDTCLICRGEEGDSELKRVLVWEDSRWRLTTSLYSEISGFSYLEPKRHIPYISDLNGLEAETLGVVLSRVTNVLLEVTDADKVYIYVFGETIPHLHLHLVPHVDGDLCNTEILLHSAPLIPDDELRTVASRVRERLTSGEISDTGSR